MSQLMTEDLRQPDLRRRTLPSWLLSLCAHLVLLILFALLVRTPQARGLSERPREVGIALAPGDDGQSDYYHQDPTAHDSDATDRAASAGPAPALPTETALDNLTLPDPMLPGPAFGTPTEELVPELEYSPLHRGRMPSREAINAARAEDAAMRAQRGFRGPSTEVSLFGGAPAVGNSFIFVIDRSDSMGRGGLELISRAKREFETALAGLEPVHKFQIVAYNHQLVYFGSGRELVPATEQNKQLIAKFMGGLAAIGATQHFLALSSALIRSPDVIFLLTDGGDPQITRGQMTQLLRRAQGRTTIHCLQFGRRPPASDENFMVQLARETGGTYRYLNVTKMPD